MMNFPQLSKQAWVLIFLLGVSLFFGLKNCERRRPPGILVQTEPDQVLSFGKSRFPFKEYVLEKLAAYTLTGRVLGKSRYYFEAGASLAPYDVALGWRRLSDSSYLKDLSISQGQRYLYFQWPEHFELLEEEIFNFSSNTHIIPATAEVKKQIESLRVGDLVTLKGDLVAAYLNGELTWKSSLSRKDRGAGACELMWVTSVQKID